jgi:outer membrane protein
MPRPIFTFLAILAPLTLAFTPQARAQGTPPAPEGSQPPTGPAATPSLPPPSRAMSLRDALAYARAHQPAVLAGVARLEAQKAAAGVPGAQWKPLIGVNAQLLGGTANNTTTSYVSPEYVDVPRIGGTRAVSSGTWQPYASTFVGAGIRQEAFDFGRIAAQTAAADAMVEVQKQASASALLDVSYSVVESYFATFAAKAIRKAAEDAYTRAKAHRDLAKSGVTSGMRSPIELTRAEADLARFNAGRIKARGGLETAQTVYAASVGVPDPLLDVDGTPPAPSELPALTDAITQAGARDPRILRALAEIRAQEERTRAIRAETRPEFSLTGMISGRAGGAPPSTGSAADNDGWLPNVPNWDIGVIFSWPLFDPVVSARAESSRVAENVRREELNQARFEEVVAIREAYVAVVVARDALPALEQSLDSARANWAQADARFRGGLGTAVELADAEALLADAEINLALGIFEVARTRAGFGKTIAEAI